MENIQVKNRKAARLHLSVFFCVTAFNFWTTYVEKKSCAASQKYLVLFFCFPVRTLWYIFLISFTFPSFSRSLTHRNHLRIELESFPHTVVQLINHLPASFHGDRVICRVRQTGRVGGSETSISSVIKEKWETEHVQLKSGVQAGILYVKKGRNNTRMSCEPGKNDATFPTPQENTADSGSIMASFYDLKLKCRRPVMWLSPNVQPGRSVHVRMRFFKLNSHNLHKPEHSDSRRSSEATAAASSSLKLEGKVRNL